MILFVQEKHKMKCCWRITQDIESINQYINQPINQLKESNERVGHLLRNRSDSSQARFITLWVGMECTIRCLL